MRLVAYARYSSDNQREESITAQLRAIHNWANANGHVIVKEYVDEALSARTDKRPNFLKMIEDSKIEDWNGVVVHKLDRFSRNRYNSAVYKKTLKDNNKKLFSVLEKLDDSPESIIMEAMLEGLSEYYSANLAREVKKGLTENALDCKHNGGIPPLGYSVKDSHYVVDKRESEIIKLIFNMYKTNHSYVEICSELNLRGYKTKRNKNFSKNSIHDILVNEKYIGNYTFGYGNRAKKRGQPNPDMIKIEGGMPAIIDKDTFFIVQEKMKGRKHMGGSYKAKQVYLLSGLIKCGICNEKYVGARKNKYWSVYECSGHKKGMCENKAIKKEEIEKIVVDELKVKINGLFNNVELLEKVNTKYKELYNDTENNLKIEEEKLSNVQTQINNINNAILDGFYSPEMKDKMKLLQSEKEFIERSIYLIRNISEKDEITSADINNILNTDLLKLESDNLNSIKEIIQKYIKEIIITPENINIKVVLDNTNITGDRDVCGSPPPKFEKRTAIILNLAILFFFI